MLESGFQDRFPALRILKSAALLLQEFASKLNMNDPWSFSPETSKMVLDSIYACYKTVTDSILSIESLSVLFMVFGMFTARMVTAVTGEWTLKIRQGALIPLRATMIWQTAYQSVCNIPDSQ